MVKPVDSVASSYMADVFLTGTATEYDPKKSFAKPLSPSSRTDTLVRIGSHVVSWTSSRHMTLTTWTYPKRAMLLSSPFVPRRLLGGCDPAPTLMLFGTEWIFWHAIFMGWYMVSFMSVRCSIFTCVIWPVVKSWGIIVRLGRGFGMI